MKRTVKGVVCDTATASKLGVKYVGEFGQQDGYEEQLFVTKDKSHFLYGVGGPESPYKKPAIKLIADSQAKEWKKDISSS